VDSIVHPALLKKEMFEMTVSQRNALVENYLWCIDSVIWQNKTLVIGAHLDREDVYQSLALRLIRAVGRYDPSKGRSLKGYIFDQLKYELLSCSSPQAKYGFREAPYHLYDTVVSMDSLAEDDPYWESRIAA